MYINHKNKNPRRFSIFVDVFHIVVCIGIVVLAVLLFLNPEENKIFFPIVFFLAMLLNAVTAVAKWKTDSLRGGRVFSVIFFGIVAAALFILTIVSAMSVWRG